MAVSAAVRRYFTERIFAASGRDRAPPNFTPLDREPTGRATVEGCRGGGKNILEVHVHAEGGCVTDVRLSCGLCNPAMYVAADVVAGWARGRTYAEVLTVDPLDRGQLDPFWDRLGGPGRPDDAREKLQYAILALQRAVYDARGMAPPPLPEVDVSSDRDGADEDDDET